MSTEKALLEGARRYDETALVEIYDRFSPGIFRYAMRLLGDSHLAEECVAETFSRFLNALKQGNGPRQYLQAYLYRIAHNWITDSYRCQPAATILPEDRADLRPEADPSHSAGLEFERQELRAALARLTPSQRQVIVLKYLEDWQNDEIACALDKPVGAIKALQHRALRALKRFLEPEQEEVQ